MTFARPCIACGRVIRTGSRCAACQLPPAPRATATERGYDAEWRRLASKMIRLEPWCHARGGCPHADANTPANPLTLDHRVPRSRGGTSDVSNVTVLCRKCNSRKGTRVR